MWCGNPSSSVTRNKVSDGVVHVTNLMIQCITGIQSSVHQEVYCTEAVWFQWNVTFGNGTSKHPSTVHKDCSSVKDHRMFGEFSDQSCKEWVEYRKARAYTR